MFQMVFFLIFGVATADAKFILSVEVQDTFGRVQEVQVYAERVILLPISEETKMPRSLYLKPYVAFPNRKKALIGVESELSQKICERLAGDSLEKEKVEAEVKKAEEVEAEAEEKEAEEVEVEAEEKAEAEEVEAVAKKAEAVEITSNWGFTELLNYRRGIFTGTFIVLGSEGKYYEAEMGYGDKAIRTFVCSGPIF